MKHFLVTFLIASLLFTSVFSAQLKADQINYLKNLKASGSEFGKNLFNAIQLVLSADGNQAIDKIQEILAEMENDLNNAQSDRSSQYQTDSAQCASDLANLNDAINQATSDLQDFQSEETSLNDDIDYQNTLIGQFSLLISQYQDNLQQLTSIRETQKSEYASTFDEYSNDISVLTNAKELIKQLKAGSAFIEKKYELKQKPAMVELTNHFKNLQSSKGKGVHSFANFFMTLLQQPGIQADQEVVQLILDTIDNLIAQLINTLNTYTEVENQRQNDFDTTSAAISAQIDQNQNYLNAAQSQLASDNVQLAFVQSQITQTQETLDAKTVQLGLRTNECNDIENNYQNATQNYNDELDIIHQVQAIFEGIEANQGQMDVIKNLDVDTSV